MSPPRHISHAKTNGRGAGSTRRALAASAAFQTPNNGQNWPSVGAAGGGTSPSSAGGATADDEARKLWSGKLPQNACTPLTANDESKNEGRRKKTDVDTRVSKIEERAVLISIKKGTPAVHVSFSIFFGNNSRFPIPITEPRTSVPSLSKAIRAPHASLVLSRDKNPNPRRHPRFGDVLGLVGSFVFAVVRGAGTGRDRTASRRRIAAAVTIHRTARVVVQYSPAKTTPRFRT